MDFAFKGLIIEKLPSLILMLEKSASTSVLKSK